MCGLQYPGAGNCFGDGKATFFLAAGGGKGKAENQRFRSWVERFRFGWRNVLFSGCFILARDDADFVGCMHNTNCACLWDGGAKKIPRDRERGLFFFLVGSRSMQTRAAHRVQH